MFDFDMVKPFEAYLEEVIGADEFLVTMGYHFSPFTCLMRSDSIVFQLIKLSKHFINIVLLLSQGHIYVLFYKITFLFLARKLNFLDYGMM